MGRQLEPRPRVHGPRVRCLVARLGQVVLRVEIVVVIPRVGGVTEREPAALEYVQELACEEGV